MLRPFAHGRVPRSARDLLDTDDLVQVTVIRALTHIERFEPRHEGAFLAYLRQILRNRIRDEVRRVARRPERKPLHEHLADPGRSPVEDLIGRDALERYETALERLTAEQREAVILRLELGYTYDEIAEAMGRSSGGAARGLVARGMARLAWEMKPLREE